MIVEVPEEGLGHRRDGLLIVNSPLSGDSGLLQVPPMSSQLVAYSLLDL